MEAAVEALTSEMLRNPNCETPPLKGTFVYAETTHHFMLFVFKKGLLGVCEVCFHT